MLCGIKFASKLKETPLGRSSTYFFLSRTLGSKKEKGHPKTPIVISQPVQTLRITAS
mgnify:CR=1 FL=1